LHPNDFEWKIPPYEYVYDRNPFDVIAGTTKLRSRLESMTSLHEIKNEWQKDINKFSIIRNKYLLY